MKQYFYIFIILLIVQSDLSAQVKLFLDYDAVSDQYTVSMISERTWNTPQNLTSDIQITLKATTNQFFVKKINSLVEGATWAYSGRVNAPAESPGYDYLFFTLENNGLMPLPYRAFRPIPLFSVELESNCAQQVMLVNNWEDPFAPPNSRNINSGNTIGVLGARGDAYRGNISDLPINCPYANPPTLSEQQTETPDGSSGENSSATPPENISELLEVREAPFPNPTTGEVYFSFFWEGKSGEHLLQVFSGNGDLVTSHPLMLEEGVNMQTVDLADLENGVYHFQIIDQYQFRHTIGKVIKVN